MENKVYEKFMKTATFNFLNFCFRFYFFYFDGYDQVSESEILRSQNNSNYKFQKLVSILTASIQTEKLKMK